MRTPTLGSSEVADRSVNVLDMEAGDVESMRTWHAWFVDEINHKTLDLEYQKGTKGIVTSAGGEYFPVLLVSLQSLRRTGSTLPVEVILAGPQDYEEQICEEVLPALNSKCIILSDIIEQSSTRFKIWHYQLKAFAILFSSFENILFLDADDFPIYPPDALFSSEPFISNHLVLWPDYWTPTYRARHLGKTQTNNRSWSDSGIETLPYQNFATCRVLQLLWRVLLSFNDTRRTR